MSAGSSEQVRFGIDLDPVYLMKLRSRLAADAGANLPGAPSLGGRTVNRAGQGQEVFDLRPYVDGDDLRHLDHRATARKGSLHVKRFHEERNAKLMLVLDLRPAMFFGIRRAFYAFAAAELLVLEGWAHLARMGHVGLYAFTNDHEVHLKPKPRDDAMFRVIGELSALYKIGMQDAVSGATSAALSDRLAGVVKLGERGSMMIIASSFDRPGEGMELVLSQLRHRFRLHAYCIGLPALEDLPEGRYPVMSEQSGRSDIAGFGQQNLPPFLSQTKGDRLIDAASEPDLGSRS